MPGFRQVGRHFSRRPDEITGLLTFDIKLISLFPNPEDTTMKENPLRSLPGIPFLLAVLAIGAFATWLLITGANAPGGGR